MFLLVPAYPGCAGSKAVKPSLLLLYVIGVRSPAGVRGGNRQLVPYAIPGRGVDGTGERDWGSAMADWPPNGRPGNRLPSDAAGQSVDVADRWVRETAGSGRVSGAVVCALKHRLGTRCGDAIADRPPGTGNPRPAVGRSSDIAGGCHI